MPNKPTKRDRREASKQQRLESEQRAKKQRRMRYLYGGIGAAAVIGLVVALVLASGKSTTVNVAALNRAAAAAGCSSLQQSSEEGHDHVNLGTHVNYGTNPPTSGDHYPVTGNTIPAPTGVHLSSPIQNEIQVHNLEHGHIGIQYADNIPAAVRTALENFTRGHDTWVFMAPRDQPPSASLPTGVQVAFTAWTRLISCTSLTDASSVVALAQTFYDDYHGQGREFVPGTPIS